MMIDANGNPIPCQPIKFNHVRIIPPEGYEIDKENSTFENIVFKKKNDETSYKQVLALLFHRRSNIYSDSPGIVSNVDEFIKCHENRIIFNNSKNYQKIVALTKLINVAEYLNQGRKDNMYSIYVDSKDKIRFSIVVNCFGQVSFNTEGLARRAVDILGEETIKLALSK